MWTSSRFADRLVITTLMEAMELKALLISLSQI